MSGFVFALSEGMDEKEALKMAISAAEITIMEENTVSKKMGYLYSLLKEIDYYYQGELLDTLYFGG